MKFRCVSFESCDRVPTHLHELLVELAHGLEALPLHNATLLEQLLLLSEQVLERTVFASLNACDMQSLFKAQQKNAK